jgi:hypothetical protein
MQHTEKRVTVDSYSYCVPMSLNIFALKMEAVRFSESSVITRATPRQIREEMCSV